MIGKTKLFLKKVWEYGFPNSRYHHNISDLMGVLDSLSDEEWKYIGEMSNKQNKAAIFLIGFYEARASEEKKKKVGQILGRELG